MAGLRHVLRLGGPPGSGKTTVARVRLGRVRGERDGDGRGRRSGTVLAPGHGSDRSAA